MEQSTLLPISVGSLVKKIVGINPDLPSPQVSQLIRDASSGGFGSAGTLYHIDQDKAVALAKATLIRGSLDFSGEEKSRGRTAPVPAAQQREETL